VTASLWAVSHFVKFFCHKLEIATKRPNFLRIQIAALEPPVTVILQN